MNDEEIIRQLLAQKATATPEEARRIRRQLRALGFSIREQGSDPNAPITVEGAPRGPGRPKKGDASAPARVRREKGGEVTVSLKKAGIHSMEEEGVRAIVDHITSTMGVKEINYNQVGKDETGYGFDLLNSVKPDDIINKFRQNWPTQTPTWCCVLGNPGTVRILLIGPVVRG